MKPLIPENPSPPPAVEQETVRKNPLKEPGDAAAKGVQIPMELLKACNEAAALIVPRQIHPRIPLGATRQNAAEVIRQMVVSFAQPVIDFAEWGWTIIANAGGGDWEKESLDWQEAAARYRDEFHDKIRHYAPSVEPTGSKSDDGSGLTQIPVGPSDGNALNLQMALEAEVRKVIAALKDSNDLGPTLGDGVVSWPLGAEILYRLEKCLSSHATKSDSGPGYPTEQPDPRPCYKCGLRADQHPWVADRGGRKRGDCPKDSSSPSSPLQETGREKGRVL